MKKITDLQKGAAIVLGLFPFILMFVFLELRSSISDYAYAKNTYLFPFLLALPMVFYVLDAYLTQRKYNYILAFGLVLVALFAHIDFPILHYTGAGIFFGGLTFFAIKYSSNKQRLYITLFFATGLIFLVTSRLFYEQLFIWAEIYMVILASILSYGELTGKID